MDTILRSMLYDTSTEDRNVAMIACDYLSENHPELWDKIGIPNNEFLHVSLARKICNLVGIDNDLLTRLYENSISIEQVRDGAEEGEGEIEKMLEEYQILLGAKLTANVILHRMR